MKLCSKWGNWTEFESTAINSWERYRKLKTDNDKITILGDAEVMIKRLRKEIKETRPRPERLASATTSLASLASTSFASV